MTKEIDRDALVQYIEECRAFLTAIRRVEYKTDDLDAASQYTEAVGHFATVLALKERAIEMGFVDDETFMVDQSGRSHWVGDDPHIISGKESGRPYVESKVSHSLSGVFNYKIYCRTPVRSIIKAAERSLNAETPAP